MYLLTKSAKCVAAYKKEVRQYARNCAYDAIWREFYELTEGALEAFFENVSKFSSNEIEVDDAEKAREIFFPVFRQAWEERMNEEEWVRKAREKARKSKTCNS